MSNLRVSKNDYLFHVPLPVQPSLKFNTVIQLNLLLENLNEGLSAYFEG